MSEAELEPAQFWTQVGLAERVVHEPHGAGRDSQIAPQERTQDSVRDNEAAAVALESQARAPVPFVTRERRVEAGGCFRRNV